MSKKGRKTNIHRRATKLEVHGYSLFVRHMINSHKGFNHKSDVENEVIAVKTIPYPISVYIFTQYFNFIMNIFKHFGMNGIVKFQKEGRQEQHDLDMNTV